MAIPAKVARAMLARRAVLAGGAGLLALPGAVRAAITPRMRVIIDNDLGGDPDGLFALAHHLASPSVVIPLIVGSHLHADEAFDVSLQQSVHAVEQARALMALMPGISAPPAIAGASAAGPGPTPASARIVAEAMRTDTRLPLFYAAGAGLTELAAAHRLNPAIERRLTLVWIGGREHDALTPGLSPRSDPEYNHTIAPEAARYIFNETAIPIWQVPRDTYRRMLISRAELGAAMALAGALGAHLLAAIDRVAALTDRAGIPIGETYILGDSPLVTLTALQSSFEPDPSSSDSVMMPTPRLDEAGRYIPRADGRPMRVWRTIDTRLTFGDMAAKLSAFRSAAAPRG